MFKLPQLIALLLFLGITFGTTGGAFAKDVQVKGYTKKDGTKVAGYTRTDKDKPAAKDTTKQEVKGYTKKDGTVVKGYTRTVKKPAAK
jgi:hypothetical protein